MVMDYLRSGYRVRARLIAGSDATGFIRWRRAEPGAKVFPHQHAFGSLVWEGDHRQEWEGPGETTRSRTWSPSLGVPVPGDHFHGEASWFLHGVPASVAAGPAPGYRCNLAAVRGTGGGAGGGAQPGAGQIGVGGGAGSGTGWDRVQIGRGGGAGGGIGPQTGPALLVGRGGGAGGGEAPVTGPLLQVGRGGGAGGGIGDQTPGGITTACNPSHRLPTVMWLQLAGTSSCNPNPGLILPMTWNSGVQRWVSTEFDVFIRHHATVTIECRFGVWWIRALDSGVLLSEGTPTFVQPTPFAASFTFNVFANCPMVIWEIHP